MIHRRETILVGLVVALVTGSAVHGSDLEQVHAEAVQLGEPDRRLRKPPLQCKVNLLRAALMLCVTLARCPLSAQPAHPVCASARIRRTWPVSNQAGEGSENRIAQELARDLGRTTVQYTWFPQRMGFVRRSRRAEKVAMGVRFGEKEWKETLDRWIAGHNEKIHAILREYGVPLLDE